MKKFKNIALIILTFFFIVIVGCCGIYNYMLKPTSKESKVVEIEIPKNTSIKQIATILEDNHLIKNKPVFLLYVKIYNATDLKAGYYDLDENMGVKKIVEVLKKGSKKNPNEIQITFQEGINMRKIAEIIGNKTNNSYDDVISKTNDSNYLDSLIEKYWFITESVKNSELYYGLEGYLFPDTYRFDSKDVSIETIFEKMLDEMNNVLTPYKEKIEKQDLSIHQVLTLSSMIEKEAARDVDRANVSSVFYNRIKANMTLGSDVTTRYALKIDDAKKTISNFQIKSPYNTRLTDGSMNGKLPVGPICIVSKESIDAAINPRDTDYLYFIANIETLETFFYKDYSAFLTKKNELAAVNKGF